MIKNIKQFLTDCLKKPELVETRFRYRDLPFFFRFVKPAWKSGVAALMLTVIMAALSSVLPLSSKVVIDFVIMKKGFQKVEGMLRYLDLESLIPHVRHFLESLDLIVIALLGIGVLIGLTGILQQYLMIRFQQGLTFNLQTALFDHMLRFPLSFFKQKQTGYLMSRVSDDVDALQHLFSVSISQVITKVSLVFFGVAILFALNVKLALITLCILPIYIIINYFFAGRLRSSSRSEREAHARVSENLQEVISGVEVIKSHAAEEREVARVSGKIATAIHTRIRNMMLLLLSDYSVRAIRLLTTLLILWFGVHEILGEAMTIGDYVALTSYVVYLYGAVNTLCMVHIMLQPVFASLDRLLEIFRIIPESEHDETGVLRKLDRVRGEMVFKDVWFSYGNNKPVLSDITFDVHPGEVVALVGPSGTGKTTLINLILKFYLPQSGAIVLDGLDLREVDSTWLRQQIGIVSQDVFLFNDTLENNIRYGNPRASKEAVVHAARMAHIHKDIEGFVDTYDTVVGERGARLSAGQRQRVSIARAFLKDPPILIFDEPTSALDAETEQLLKDSLANLLQSRTTFIIAHRNSLLDIAHKVVVLDRGKIREIRYQA